MRTDARTSKMKAYFTVFEPEYPPMRHWLLKFAIASILFGLFIMYFFNNTILAGIAFILTGWVLFAVWAKPYFRGRKVYSLRPKEEEMINWLIKDLNTIIKETAIKKLRLNMSTLETKNFILVPYPVFWEVPGVEKENLLKRNTESGNVLYSVWNVQVIALTVNYISYYTCTYDWLNNLILHERTNEFFYDDISSVKNDVELIEHYLADKNYTDEEGKQLPPDKLTANVFVVKNMSTDTLKVITNILEMKHPPQLVVDLEKAVLALRIILRKRRYDEDQDPVIVERNEEIDTNETEEQNKNQENKNHE